MIEHVYNLGNQINQELLVSDNFESPDYQNLLIVAWEDQKLEIFSRILNTHQLMLRYRKLMEFHRICKS